MGLGSSLHPQLRRENQTPGWSGSQGTSVGAGDGAASQWGPQERQPHRWPKGPDVGADVGAPGAALGRILPGLRGPLFLMMRGWQFGGDRPGAGNMVSAIWQHRHRDRRSQPAWTQGFCIYKPDLSTQSRVHTRKGAVFTMESPVSLRNGDLDVGRGHRDRKKSRLQNTR